MSVVLNHWHKKGLYIQFKHWLSRLEPCVSFCISSSLLSGWTLIKRLDCNESVLRSSSCGYYCLMKMLLRVPTHTHTHTHFVLCLSRCQCTQTLQDRFGEQLFFPLFTVSELLALFSYPLLILISLRLIWGHFFPSAERGKEKRSLPESTVFVFYVWGKLKMNTLFGSRRLQRQFCG